MPIHLSRSTALPTALTPRQFLSVLLSAFSLSLLITMQQHPDPIDWAAFTLIGEVQ